MHYIYVMDNTSKIINIAKLAKAADVSYFQIYRRNNGETSKPLDPKSRTRLFNALMKDVKAFAKELGFEVTFRRTEDPL